MASTFTLEPRRWISELSAAILVGTLQNDSSRVGAYVKNSQYFTILWKLAEHTMQP